MTHICKFCNTIFKPKAGSTGKYCSLVCCNANKQNTMQKVSRGLREKQILTYADNPKYCKECGCIIPYNKKVNKFCNHSCSASYNTPLHPTKAKSIKVKKQKTSRPKKEYHDCLCKFCNNIFQCKTSKRICNICRISQVHNYRAACSFNLNSKQFPELYDSELIRQYGWYSASNSKKPNLTGLTWDHLFRISDARKLMLDPKIVSHPANAELVPWPINNLRTKSMISYEILIERIRLWDSGNRNLEKFFFVDGEPIRA